MRRLILIAAAATLALAGCDPSVNADLEREVNAAVAALKLPRQPAFPSLNAETIAWLSQEVPALTPHRRAIEAADKAILARAAAKIGSPDPSGPAASGTGPGPLTALPASGSPVRSSMGGLDWIAPPAHAQSMDGYTVTAVLTGNATALMLGGVADVAGGAGSRTETIDGGNGEKATINISRDADGVTTTSVESNVDVLVLGLVAGAKTTFISKSLCPDPSGRVEFTIKLSQAGKAGAGAGGTASMDSQVEAHVVLTVDDNAAVGEQDIRTRYARKSAAKGGNVNFQGEVDWQRSGTGAFRPVAERAGPQSGAVTDKMHTSAMVQAVSLAIGAIVGAEHHWSSGACIRIDAKSPGRVDPRAKSDIPVAVISKIDDGAVAARLTATLTGGASVDPAEIARTPGTIVHTAPDAKKARMTIRLDTVSRRGKATAKLDLLISEGAYSIEGGAGDFRGTGLICDIAQPFTVEGNGVTVNFTPGSPQGGSYRYLGSIAGFRLVGTGTYTVRYQGEVATGIVATGPGQVGTAYGMVSGSGDEHYELTPVHNYRCE